MGAASSNSGKNGKGAAAAEAGEKRDGAAETGKNEEAKRGAEAIEAREAAEALEAQDAARREFARMLLAIDDSAGGWACSLSVQGRAVIAGLLLLPAGDGAASPVAVDAALGMISAVAAMHEQSRVERAATQGLWPGLALPAKTIFVTEDGCAARDRVCEAAAALVAVRPPSTDDFSDQYYARMAVRPASPYSCGSYALRTPEELRESVLPRAHLLLGDARVAFLVCRSSIPEFTSSCVTGHGFLSDMITFSENVRRAGPPETSPLQGAGAMWRPAMAPWAVAVAVACGAFQQPLADLARGPGAAPPPTQTPFSLMCQAVRRAPEIADALLDVPARHGAAIQVENHNGEVTPSGSPVNLLHIHIAWRHGEEPALFRRLVGRCGARTLNEPGHGLQSVLHAVVDDFCHSAGAGRLALMEGSLDMAQALLDRADSDAGGGVDLRPPAAREAIRRLRASKVAAHQDSNMVCRQLHCRLIEQLDDAFEAAAARQRDFRERLLPTLDAVLQGDGAGAGGLRVTVVLQLVVAYVLRPAELDPALLDVPAS
jgi:hypothetical protein